MKWIVLIVLLAVATVLGIVLLVRHTRRLQVGRVMPYSDLRQEFFKAARGGKLSPLKKFRSGQSKDFRLPRAAWTPVQSIAKLDDANFVQVTELIGAVEASISDEVNSRGGDADALAQLSPGRRAVYLAWCVEMEVNNGGFDQYYLNSSGEGAWLAPDALRLLGDVTVASLVERANAVFPGGPPTDREQRLLAMETFGDDAHRTWEECDNRFFELPGVAAHQFAYIRSHLQEFFRDR